jgi:hypothetical protein
VDTVLVGSSWGPTPEHLAQWSLDSLDRIVHSAALGSSKARLTAMSEFALVATIVRDRGFPGAEWRREVLHRLRETYGHTDLLDSLRATPESAPAHAWIVEALHGEGNLSRSATEAVHEALIFTSQAGEAGSLSAIQSSYLRHRLAWSTTPPTLGTDTDDVRAYAWPERWKLASDGEVYDLLHLIFFLTDFGEYRWARGGASLPTPTSIVRELLERAAAAALRRRQLDLLGEIAIAKLCLERSADVRPLLNELQAAQVPGGGIPGWRGPRGIRGYYHSTLVAVLAFSLGMS